MQDGTAPDVTLLQQQDLRKSMLQAGVRLAIGAFLSCVTSTSFCSEITQADLRSILSPPVATSHCVINRCSERTRASSQRRLKTRRRVIAKLS